MTINRCFTALVIVDVALLGMVALAVILNLSGARHWLWCDRNVWVLATIACLMVVLTRVLGHLGFDLVNGLC